VAETDGRCRHDVDRGGGARIPAPIPDDRSRREPLSLEHTQQLNAAWPPRPSSQEVDGPGLHRPRVSLLERLGAGSAAGTAAAMHPALPIKGKRRAECRAFAAPVEPGVTPNAARAEAKPIAAESVAAAHAIASDSPNRAGETAPQLRAHGGRPANSIEPRSMFLCRDPFGTGRLEIAARCQGSIANRVGCGVPADGLRAGYARSQAGAKAGARRAGYEARVSPQAASSHPPRSATPTSALPRHTGGRSSGPGERRTPTVPCY